MSTTTQTRSDLGDGPDDCGVLLFGVSRAALAFGATVSRRRAGSATPTTVTGCAPPVPADGDTKAFVWATAGTLPLLLSDGTHRYLYGPTLTPYAQVATDGTTEYLHTDQQGTVTHITDAGLLLPRAEPARSVRAAINGSDTSDGQPLPRRGVSSQRGHARCRSPSGRRSRAAISSSL
ncbi:hypothetical protein AB0J80_37570 [Actinoplanes sp. NPDC049548]|uniref:hypothetical protein n=1 Tax=Actinoplanes sp. NPDC049548 TaxID=3155152 RepID=UPI0034159445